MIGSSLYIGPESTRPTIEAVNRNQAADSAVQPDRSDLAISRP